MEEPAEKATLIAGFGSLQGEGEDRSGRLGMSTIRHQIIALLEKEALNAIELSQGLGIREKEVYEHLPHIARSVTAQGKRFVIDPSRCLKCGYVFEDRKRFTRPGRCPRCRETYIRKPSYWIRSAKEKNRGSLGG